MIALSFLLSSSLLLFPCASFVPLRTYTCTTPTTKGTFISFVKHSRITSPSTCIPLDIRPTQAPFLFHFIHCFPYFLNRHQLLIHSSFPVLAFSCRHQLHLHLLLGHLLSPHLQCPVQFQRSLLSLWT